MLDIRRLSLSQVTTTVVYLLALLFCTSANTWVADPDVYVVILACGLLPLLSYRGKSQQLFLTRLDGVALLCFGYLICRQLFIKDGLQEDYVVSLVCCGLLYIFLRARPITPNTFAYLILMGLYLELGLVLWNLFTPDQPWRSLKGSFYNSGVLAIFLALASPTLMHLLFSSSRKSIVFFLSLTGTIGVLIVSLLLPSRTALLLELAAVGLGFIRKAPNVKKRILTTFILSLIFGLSLVSIATLVKTDSSNGRVLIWKVSSGMIQDHPTLGIGLGGFAVQYSNYQASYFRNRPTQISHYGQLADITFYAFNEYLQLTVETGLIGLSFILSLLIYAIFTGFKRSSVEGLYADTLLLGAIAAGFYYAFHVLPILMIMVICLAGISSAASPRLFRLGYSYPYFLLAAAAMSSLTEVYGIGQYRVYQKWSKAAGLVLENEDQAVSLYDQVLPQLSHKGTFLFNYGAELYEMGRYAKALKILEMARGRFTHINLYLYLGKTYERLGNYEQTNACYQYLIDLVPNRFYPRYFLAKLEFDAGHLEASKRNAMAILVMPVKIPSNDVTVIKEEMRSLIQQIQRQQEIPNE